MPNRKAAETATEAEDGDGTRRGSLVQARDTVLATATAARPPHRAARRRHVGEQIWASRGWVVTGREDGALNDRCVFTDSVELPGRR